MGRFRRSRPEPAPTAWERRTDEHLPTTSSNGSNYFVDVLFAEAPAPGQVTNVSASAGVEWRRLVGSTPSSGGPVATYTVTPYIGSTAQTATTVTGTPPAATTTITGLKARTEYTFKVQASSVNGSGTASAASAAITPLALAAPSPTGVSATAATGQALVSWSAPSNNGGSAITGYTITPYAGATALTPVTENGTETSATIGRLSSGTAYTFTVAASNPIGTGSPSAASAPVTPSARSSTSRRPQRLKQPNRPQQRSASISPPRSTAR